MEKLRILHLVLILAVCAANCGYSANNKFVIEAEKNLPMETEITNDAKTRRINLQTVSFSAPEGFADQSINSEFIKPKYNETLKKRMVGSELERVSAAHFVRGKAVSDGKVAVKVTDIESARKSFHTEIEGLKEEAKNLYGVGSLTIKIESFMEKQLLLKEKFPTLMTGQIIGEIGKKMEYRREAYVFDSQQTFFYLLYVTEEDGEKIQQRFERMVESLELNTPEFMGDTPTSDGYFRRYSGNVTLEVPADLISARRFVYEKYRSENDASPEKKVLRLILLEPDDQENLPKTNPEESKYNPGRAYSGRIISKVPVMTDNKFYKGEITKYSIVQDEEYQDINPSLVKKITVIWGRLENKNGNAIILEGKSPSEKENELNAAFEKWMQSFVPATERSNQR